MTVSTSTSRIAYTGNGVTTSFSVPFPFIQDDYLIVIRTVIATGAETVLTLNSVGPDGYSVTGAGGPSGNVIVVTAPTALERLSIIRSVDATQEADFVANDPLPSEVIEDSLDKLTMLFGDLAGANGLSRVPKLYAGDIDGSGRYNSNGNRYANAADGVDPSDLATVQQVVAAGSGNFIQAGTGAVTRTMQDKAREVKTSADFGSSFKHVVEYRNGPDGTGDSVIAWPELNGVASDLNACVISGGGSPLNENLIGYQEYSDDIVGDAVTTVFTSTFDIDDTSEVRVSLVRADNVRLGVTYLPSCLIEKVAGKARVTYPTPGHFVNDAPAGAEGTNPALLSTQQLIIYSVNKEELTGTNANLSGIAGGYDNIIERGIMTHIMGAHHRVYDGSHNTIWGGSFGRIDGGEYGGIWGGTNNRINVGLTSGSIIAGGGANRITGAGPSTIVGGTGNSVSGVAATSVGGASNTVTGNGATATGRNHTVAGQDAFAAGNGNTVAGNYSAALGLTNTTSGAYSLTYGRLNIASGAYSMAAGQANTASADWTQASGYRAIADFIGESATGFGKSSDSSDGWRQLREAGWSIDTTDATTTYMQNSGGGNALVIPENGSAMVRVDAIALRDDNTQAQAFTGNFLVTRSGAGDPLVNGAATDQALTSVNALGGAAWTCAVRGISASLRMRVTGEAAKNIRWLAVMRVVQVVH